MFENLGKYWYICFGFLGAVGLLWYQSKRDGSNTGLLGALRNNINRHEDPESPLYDPGMLGRQLRLIAIGLPLIALALLLAWFVQT